MSLVYELEGGVVKALKGFFTKNYGLASFDENDMFICEIHINSCNEWVVLYFCNHEYVIRTHTDLTTAIMDFMYYNVLSERVAPTKSDGSVMHPL